METQFEKYPKFSQNKIQERRTRVFTLIKRPDACYYYRILTPHQQLARQYGWECKYNTIDPLPHQIQAGIPSTVDHQSVDSSLKNLLDCHMEYLEWADIIIMQRPTCDHHLELMRYIQREMKKAVVYEADDNYIDVPLHNPGHKYFEPRSEYIKNLIREADLLTVTTEHLADIYRPLRRGKSIVVCPNSINFETLDNAETTMLKYEVEDKRKYFLAMKQLRLGIDNDLYEKYREQVNTELLKEVKNVLSNPNSKSELQKHNVAYTQDAIMEFFQHSNREVRIQVSDEEYARDVNGATIIGWSGSPTHREDLAIITNPLMKILNQHKDVVLGMWGFIHHEWLNMIDRKQLWLFGLVPVKYYYTAHKQIGFSISLCPVNPDQFNRGKCVAGDSLVIANSKIHKIKDLSGFRESDKIDSDCTGDIVTPQGVNSYEGFYYSEKQKTVKIITENGYEIEGTLDHKILCNGEWKQLKDVGVDSEIEIQNLEDVFLTKEYQYVSYPLLNSRFYTEDCKWGDMAPAIKITEDWGRFFGYFIGNGCFTGTCCSISTDKNFTEYVDDVCSLFDRMGLKWTKVLKKEKDVRSPESNGVDIKVSSSILVKFIKHCGIKPRKKDHRKKGDSADLMEIPYFILRSPKSVVREFLKGLFESDGYVCKESAIIELSQKSERLINQVQFLLLLFGIKSRKVIKYKKSQNWEEKRPYTCLYLNSKSARLFSDRIGFCSEIKNKTLTDRCDKKPSNAFVDWDWKEKIVHVLVSENDVFDIQVPLAKQYIANGFVSHNSNLKAIESCALGQYTIASKYATYEGCPREMPLCETPEEWAREINIALNDSAMRMEIGIRNREFVERHYDIATNVDIWKKAYEELI